MKKPTLLAQIAPQRSAQYSQLASSLVSPELQLSSLGALIESMSPRTIAGQEYLEIELTAQPHEGMIRELGSLAMSSSFFYLHPQIGDTEGPFLEPIETGFLLQQPKELITSRRYRGKTNELFTHFLCNLAKFSSKYAELPWDNMNLMDPLAGGGTTLMTGLVLGAKIVAGIEQNENDAQSTPTFLKQFAKEEGIPVKLRDERLKKLGKRWTVTLGEDSDLRRARLKSENIDESDAGRNAADRQSFIFAQGDTSQARFLLPGFKPHVIVGDLPYGIQHQGKLVSLLDQALPVWSAMLRKGGTIVLSWDATRFTKEKMHECVQKHDDITLLVESPYDSLAHQVDRVIKNRDVVVLRK